jgi:hypothetical protein
LATSLMLDKGVGYTSGGDVAVFGDAKAIPELQSVRRTRRICHSQVLSYRQLRAITVCASLSFVADPRWREGLNSREDGLSRPKKSIQSYCHSDASLPGFFHKTKANLTNCIAKMSREIGS